jgi:hypothetical protein
VPKLEHLALGEQNAKDKAMQKKHIVLCWSMLRMGSEIGLT